MKYKVIFSKNAKEDLLYILKYIRVELLYQNIAENNQIEY